MYIQIWFGVDFILLYTNR